MMNTVAHASRLHRTGCQPAVPTWDEDDDDSPVEEFTEDEVVQLHVNFRRYGAISFPA